MKQLLYIFLFLFAFANMNAQELELIYRQDSTRYHCSSDTIIPIYKERRMCTKNHKMEVRKATSSEYWLIIHGCYTRDTFLIVRYDRCLMLCNLYIKVDNRHRYLYPELHYAYFDSLMALNNKYDYRKNPSAPSCDLYCKSLARTNVVNRCGILLIFEDMLKEYDNYSANLKSYKLDKKKADNYHWVIACDTNLGYPREFIENTFSSFFDFFDKFEIELYQKRNFYHEFTAEERKINSGNYYSNPEKKIYLNYRGSPLFLTTGLVSGREIWRALHAIWYDEYNPKNPKLNKHGKPFLEFDEDMEIDSELF